MHVIQPVPDQHRQLTEKTFPVWSFVLFQHICHSLVNDLYNQQFKLLIYSKKMFNNWWRHLPIVRWAKKTDSHSCETDSQRWFLDREILSHMMSNSHATCTNHTFTIPGISSCGDNFANREKYPQSTTTVLVQIARTTNCKTPYPQVPYMTYVYMYSLFRSTKWW